jgi:hypothetical protein
MKNLQVIFLVLIMALISCSNDFNEMEDIILGQNQMEEESIILQGNFVSGAHTTSGVASVNKDKTILSFTNFKTDNGPKLLVYLATDENVSEFVDLGELKGIEGDFDYAIPNNTDLAKYKFVDIWCVAASVSFGRAELK